MSSMARKARERIIKSSLMDQLKSSNIDLNEIVEWLWDDFGKRVRREWSSIEKAVLGDSDISPQDIAVFMIEHGVTPNEGAWDVEPRRAMHGGKGSVKRF